MDMSPIMRDLPLLFLFYGLCGFPENTLVLHQERQ